MIFVDFPTKNYLGRYLHQNNLGWLTWPAECRVYAAPQPALPPADMTPAELAVLEFFQDAEKVGQLVAVLSLEDIGGKYSSWRYRMFKGVFRNYGIGALRHFEAALGRLTSQHQEGMQRCAAEIMSGLVSFVATGPRRREKIPVFFWAEIANDFADLKPVFFWQFRGMKHWCFADWNRAMDTMVPLLTKDVLGNPMKDALNDWRICMDHAFRVSRRF